MFYGASPVKISWKGERTAHGIRMFNAEYSLFFLLLFHFNRSHEQTGSMDLIEGCDWRIFEFQFTFSVVCLFVCLFLLLSS